MLVLAFLSLGLCSPWLARAAAFDDAHQKLVTIAAAGGGVIQLDTASYDLLTTANRTWSASIEFTALQTRDRCDPCSISVKCSGVHPSWMAVAKAWTGVPQVHRDSHFFATLDVNNAPTVVQRLGLTSAPAIHNYPPTEGPRAAAIGKQDYWTYDFSHGFEAEPLAEQLSKATPIRIPYRPPVNWALWITIAAGVLTLAVGLLFLPILLSVWTWTIATIATSLVMTSGYMFTRIRESPLVAPDGSWIARGTQNQFGREVHMVFAIYGTLAFSFLMLIVVVPYQRPGLQRLYVYFWSAIIVLVYSVLVVFYKVKNRWYPYRLLL
ncbi:oligosaccharyl transferase subunit OST3/OST6 family [Mycena capillaripes]|nr:oligosaccharyl transferase subunit OST3/OST6 family [Mycena capillaripes]